MLYRRKSCTALTFELPHLFRAVLLLHDERFIGRSSLSRDLHIGEGAARTLITLLKKRGLAETVRSGTRLTVKGRSLAARLVAEAGGACVVPETGLLGSSHNHAMLLRGYADAVRSGVEQRDYAIMYGAEGAVTLICHNGDLFFPTEMQPAFPKGENARKALIERLAPSEGDVVIIATSGDPHVSEIAVTNAALQTIESCKRA